MRAVFCLVLVLGASCGYDELESSEASVREAVSPKAEVRECTTLPTVSCRGDAEVAPCAELDTARGPEQLVCCPGTFRVAHRLCGQEPLSMTACGQAGPAGCAVCFSEPYERLCKVNPGHHSVTGVYRGEDGRAHVLHLK